MPAPELAPWFEAAAASPLALRAGLGLLGTVLLAAGGRLVDLAIPLMAFGAGAVGMRAALWEAARWSPALDETMVVLAACAVAGVVAVVIVRFVQRLALILVGLVLGATVGGAIAELMQPGAAPLTAPALGSVVGAIAVPLLFRSLLKVVTSGVGAMLILWAAGIPQHALIGAGLWGLGLLVQLGSGRGREE